MDKKHYTISLLVRDEPGVLSQVARLFSRKGYNIHSIASGESHQKGITRITIVILGTEAITEQLAAQCRKLIPVIAVKILNDETSLKREVALIKVSADHRGTRDEIIQTANIFRASIVDVSREVLTVACFGDSDKIEALINLLSDYGIKEIVRTGTIALERGKDTIHDSSKLTDEYNYGKSII